MAKAATKSRKKPKFPIISLSYLAEKSGVDYKLIYNNVAGNYSSLENDPNLKTQIMNAAFQELVPFFDFLGFEIKVKRKPPAA
jgi:hypothetical protein